MRLVVELFYYLYKRRRKAKCLRLYCPIKSKAAKCTARSENIYAVLSNLEFSLANDLQASSPTDKHQPIKFLDYDLSFSLS